jgi:hypothetical protein
MKPTTVYRKENPMTSTRGIASAVFMLLAIPATLASQALGPWAPGIVIHVFLGASMLALAVAVFDFPLPRWVNWIGAASAGAFGAIFLLQALSLGLNDALDVIAFKILGQAPELLLPIGIFFWFAALLLRASRGRTRYVGWVIVPAVIGLQAALFIGLLTGIEVANLKVVFMLPFVWLLLESAKRAAVIPGRRPASAELAAAAS